MGLASDIQKQYNYDKPGSLTMAYRVPENFIGQTLRDVTKQTVMINSDLKSHRKTLGASPPPQESVKSET